MSIELATAKDFNYIIELSKRHAEELGFIPRAALLNHLEAGRMTVARENGDDVGYFLTNRVGQKQVRIFQACVQLDARGLKHGLALLSDLVTRCAITGSHHITLHCRDGLESNNFWSACGFTKRRIFPGGLARGKIIHEWELDLSTALGSGVLPFARHFLASLRSGPAKSTLESAGKALASTPTFAEKIGIFAHKLDTRESNVTHAHAGDRTTSHVVNEALRCLDLAASLRR